jgi:hypothetical protein
VLAGSVVTLAVIAAACGGGDDDSASDTTTTTTTTVAAQQGGGGQSGGGSGGGGQSSGGPTGPAPTIVSFTTPGDIDCHNGNQQNFTASWSTTGATRVSISGGGSNLPPSGETSLPFDCSSAHTFTLTAYSDGGQTATRSVTLQPRNVQQNTPDEDE